MYKNKILVYSHSPVAYDTISRTVTLPENKVVSMSLLKISSILVQTVIRLISTLNQLFTKNGRLLMQRDYVPTKLVYLVQSRIQLKLQTIKLEVHHTAVLSL
jgi:hypothetical protein